MDEWPETTARVISSEYHADWSDSGEYPGYDESYFLTAFSYQANGEFYVSQRRTSEPEAVGDEFTLSFDPGDPQYNSLTGPRETPGTWLARWSFIVLLACLMLYLVIHFNLEKYLDD